MKIKILLIIIATLSIYTACSNKASKTLESKTEIIPVKLVNVENQKVKLPVCVHGIVTTNEESRLSFKMPGIIKKMYVKEGDRIYKGQILAELDLTEIKAQDAQANENYEKSLRDYQRAKNLYADSVITLEQLQNMETALNISKQSQDIMTYNKNHSFIKAFSGGVILKKMASEGEYVNPGIPIYQASVENNNGFIIKAAVPVGDWVKLSELDKAEIQIDAFPGKSFPGIVKNIAQNADQSTGLYSLEIQITKQKEKIASGMFAKAEITLSRQVEYKTIPISCISEAEGFSAFVFTANGSQVTKIPVHIAEVKNGTAYISHGLDSIDMVINEGAGFLTENSIISIN